jgi:hypothetical protein
VAPVTSLTGTGTIPNWHWFIPRPGGMVGEIRAAMKEVEENGNILAAYRIAERLASSLTSVYPYTYQEVDVNGSPLTSPELALGEKVPASSESAASGAFTAKITRGTPEFNALVVNDNAEIVFKDEEGTGADRHMTSRLKEKLDNLAGFVKVEFPGRRLRVTDAWDENDEHGTNSLHYEGRAADITTDDLDSAKLGRLGRLAVNAGFDWVFYEDAAHVHASVKKT